MKCAPPFSFSRLSNLCWSHISIPLCSKLWYCEVEVFFLPCSLVELLHIYLQLFPIKITFFTQFVKKPGYLLFGLPFKFFTFDRLFSHRSDFFNDLTISLTKWTEYRKDKCLSSSKNTVRLHFRERAEKTKENAKKNENRNIQNGQKKYGGRKFAYVHIWGENLKNIIISSNVSLKLLWAVIEINFLPESVYICLRKH